MKKVGALLTALLLIQGTALASVYSGSGFKTKADARDITVDTTHFTKNLSSSDKDVQHALETIDQMSGSGSGTVTSIATSNGITGGTITTTGTISGVNAAADGATKGVSTFTAADFDDNASGLISIDYANGQKASGSQPGFLSSTDWGTFNGKQASGNYITALTGDVTASGPGSVAATVAKVQGTTISGTTGTTNVVFSSAPTMTNPIVGTQTSSDNSTKAASTAYVTTAVTNALNGLDWKPAVGYATTANVVGTNTAGVFTYTATGTDSIDGHTLVLNDVVLFKNQNTGADDGVWVVTTAGALGIAGVLTRRADYNTAADVQQGDSFYVIHGTTNTNTAWAQTAVVNTIDVDAMTFSQVAGPGSYTQGNGITITGTSIAIDTSVTVDKTTVQTLSSKTLTSPTFTTPALGTPASGNLSGCTLAVADGSTIGPAAFTAADFNSSSGVISLDYANGQKASSSQPGFSTANQTVGSVGVTLDGGGSTLTTGQKGYITVPFAGTISGWNITANGSSPTCTIDVWKVANGTALPTVTNTITASALPALSTGNALHSTTLTGWTTAVAANDIIGFNLNAVTVATRITFVLEIDKS